MFFGTFINFSPIYGHYQVPLMISEVRGRILRVASVLIFEINIPDVQTLWSRQLSLKQQITLVSRLVGNYDVFLIALKHSS